jgi:hypothetical protein
MKSQNFLDKIDNSISSSIDKHRKILFFITPLSWNVILYLLNLNHINTLESLWILVCLTTYLILIKRNKYPFYSIRVQASIHCIEYIISKNLSLSGQSSHMDLSLLIILPLYLFLYTKSRSFIIAILFIIMIGDSLLYKHLQLYLSDFETCQSYSVKRVQFIVALSWLILMPQ